FFCMKCNSVDQWAFNFFRFESVALFKSRKQQRLPSVKRVTNYGQSGIPQVDANLVGSSGEWLALQKGPAFESFHHSESCTRAFPALWVDAHETNPERMRCQFGVHLKPVLRRPSFGQADITLIRLFGSEGVCQGHQG